MLQCVVSFMINIYIDVVKKKKKKKKKGKIAESATSWLVRIIDDSDD